MEGVRQHVHETLYSCGLREPRRSLQCDFRGNKVKAKTAISTIFFGFCAFFADFLPFLPGFAGFYPAAAPQKAGRPTLAAFSFLRLGWDGLTTAHCSLTTDH
jgi:hypothetical protein